MTDRLLRPLTADQLAELETRHWSCSRADYGYGCDVGRILDHLELLQTDLNTVAADRDRFLAENEQLRRERDTLDRFAMTEAWELHMDLPDHWYEREKHYAAVAHCEEVTARMAAAFVAAPSLNELLKEESTRDGH